MGKRGNLSVPLLRPVLSAVEGSEGLGELRVVRETDVPAVNHLSGQRLRGFKLPHNDTIDSRKR
jgi:hypothetical protein